MDPFLRSRAQRIAMAFVAVTIGGAGFLPLFGGPGYEHALATGLLAPGAAAVATAVEAARSDAAPLAAVRRGVVSGLALAGVALATALLHTLRVGVCDLSGGLLYFALTAGFGAVLGGTWGAVVAEIARRRRRKRLWASVLAAFGPVLGVLVSLVRFYTSPMIFAYDPFAGFFSGTIYDTIIDAGTALWTYRAGSAATLAGVTLVASALARAPGRLGLRVVAERAPRVRGVLGAAALLASLATVAMGSRLDHWHTPASIRRELGGFRNGTRCDVVYPDSLRPAEVDLLVKDCEEELASVEAALSGRGPDRVTAYFFRDAAEKKRLMGAANTYIAKPWRKEVYLQVAPYPHPVLGHELAHVVAGSFASGPMHVAGSLGGLSPNPGLIEGIAVAASPDDDELTDAEWCRAMLDAGILPPIRQVFSLDFLGAAAAKSYTIAGAFVRWIQDEHGAKTVQAWYGGASIEQLSGKTWDALDRDFRAHLAKYTLSPEAQGYAKAKFARPSVFGRKCPHVVDALRRDADQCRGEQRVERALALYDAALKRDPHDAGSREGRAVVLARYGDRATGRAELAAMEADEGAPRTWRDRAAEALADDDLLRGDLAAAEGRYRALASRTLDEDVARTLEVKALAATRDEARAVIVALLVGAEGRPPDTFQSALLLGEWAGRGAHDPLADYLAGRNLAQKGWFALAAARLDRALAAPEGVPTARIGRELVRARAVCACAMEDAAAVARVRELVRAPGGPFAKSAGRRETVESLLARCRAR